MFKQYPNLYVYVYFSAWDWLYSESWERFESRDIYTLQVLLFNATYFYFYFFPVYTAHKLLDLQHLFPKNATSSFILSYSQTRIFFLLFVSKK